MPRSPRWFWQRLFWQRLALVLTLMVQSGCASSLPGGASDPQVFIAALERLRAARAETPPVFTDQIAIELDAPYLPGGLRARGAVATRQPGELRMILLGPAGTTAIDLWSNSQRYRFRVPAIERDTQGLFSAPAETRRGLPVDFLAWWLLAPLRGELLAATRTDAALELVLRDGPRISVMRLADSGEVEAERTLWSPNEPPKVLEVETLRAKGLGCADATYHQRSTNLTVRVECLKRSLGARDAAFNEPDAGPR